MSSEVSLVKRKETVLETVREAISLVGGIEKYVKPGETVLLKPNLAYPYPPPATTDPEVARAVALLCMEAGASKVFIGDSSAYSKKKILGTGTWTNADVIRETGMAAMAEEIGAQIVDFDEGEWVDVEIPDGVILKKVPISKYILDVDKLINVPIIKMHLETLATLGIKNYHGIIPDHWKIQWHKDEISQKIVDLHKAVKTDLTVMDGLVGMQGLGPRLGTPVKTDLILASSDIVSIDAVTSMVMGLKYDDVEATRIASMQGIGNGNIEQIDVLGEKVEDVCIKYDLPDVRIAGIYPDFTIIKGGPCVHCYGRTKIFIETLMDKGLPENGGVKTVLTGINPKEPDVYDIDGKVALVGDCAIAGCTNLRYSLGDRCVVVEGCPPIASVHKVIDKLIDDNKS